MTKPKSREEKLKIIDQVEKIVKEKGVSMVEAAKQFGLKDHTIYNWRNKVKPKKRTKQPVQQVTFNLPEEKSMPMVILMGSPKDIQLALDRLVMVGK